MSAADRGSATVWSAALACLLCAVFMVLLMVGQVVLARHRAGAAADLAALAAAGRAWQGPEAACAAAQEVAAEQGARVVGCAVADEVSDVTAEVATGLRTPAARVRARAGPAEPVARLPAAGPAHLPSPGSRLAEQDRQEADGGRLVQGIVAVAALGGLDA